jgi:predicted small metal-binding protein
MPSIKCTDIGFDNDPFQITTKIVHNLDEIPEDLKKKIDKAIKP